MALAQIRHAETNLGPDHFNVARGLSTVALIYATSEVGVRSAGIGLYERALSLYGDGGNDDNRQQALKARVALARLYADAHAYARAERQLGLVSESVERALGRDDAAVAQFWLERGYALRESGRFEAAAGFFARALEFWDERLANEPSSIHGLRQTLEPLADTWRFAREYSRAEPLYRRLLESRDQHVVLHWSVVAAVMRKLGSTQRLSGDLTAARKTFEQVIALLEPHRPSASGNVWSVADDVTRQALRELAAVAVASNDLIAARDYLRRAGGLDDRSFWYFAGSTRDMLDENRDRFRSQFYHQALTITARYLKGDREWMGRAYDLVLDRKGIALDLELRAGDAAEPLPERTRRSLRELATVRSNLARLMLRRPESTTNAEYAKTVTPLFERAVALEKEVARIGPWNLAQLRSRVTATDVAAGLPGETALIEFVRVRDEDPAGADSNAPTEEHARYLAFVLTPAGAISLIDMGPAGAIDVLAGDLQAAIRLRANASLTSDLLRKLQPLVWAPIEGLLGGSRRIVISPDGELHRVPFAALIGGDDRSLIERFQFAYAGSGRDLARPKRARATPTLELALVADPDFGAGGRYPPLPGTAAEANQIPPLVPGSRRKILRAGEATEAAVKGLPPSRILHIATHGFLLDSATFGLEVAGYEHALVKSGLALAGANRASQPAGRDDGLLTALEVSGLDLSATDLVVLSSCDSGAGSVTQGQGVLGLRRAFSLAGARSLLLTLWPVDDKTTAEVMVDFYRNLTTVAPAVALHQAQVDLIGRIRARDGFVSPHLWAAFILESAAGFAPTGARN
jgi:CHAT domain-containing protein